MTTGGPSVLRNNFAIVILEQSDDGTHVIWAYLQKGLTYLQKACNVDRMAVKMESI